MHLCPFFFNFGIVAKFTAISFECLVIHILNSADIMPPRFGVVVRGKIPL